MRVTIELEFNENMTEEQLKLAVYNYLFELLENDALDYHVEGE